MNLKVQDNRNGCRVKDHKANEREKERETETEGDRERQRERENSNSKTLILKDSSVRSIWT